MITTTQDYWQHERARLLAARVCIGIDIDRFVHLNQSLAAQPLHFDMLSTHELVILAENAAGLSATANVVVSVFNETPQLSPLSKTVTAKVSEQNSSEDPSDAESLSATASTLPFAVPFGLSVKLRYEVE